MAQARRAVIIGAGFSGLVSAYYLLKEGYEVEVHEKEARTGGLINTIAAPWGLCETAATVISNTAKFEALAREIGVPLLAASPSAKKRYIFREKPRRWPIGPVETVDTALNFATSFKKTPRPGETITQWGTRVLGTPAARYLLGPALQGVYAGDPDQLSASLILGKYFGGKSRGKKAKPAVKGSVAPAGGMAELTKGLELFLRDHGVKFLLGRPAQLQSSYEKIQVICTNMKAAGELLQDVEPGLARELKTAELLPVASVSAAFAKDPAWLEGFGCLFPRDQGFRALGAMFSSSIFPDRSENRLETWIFGGTGDADILDLQDRDLIQILNRERAKLFGKTAEPVGYRIQRWPRAFPHYTLNLERLLREFEPTLKSMRKNGIHIVGNFTGALGLSNILELASSLPEAIRGN